MLRLSTTVKASSALLLLTSPLMATDPGAEPTLTELTALELPPEVASAGDVRWSSHSELLLGQTGQGVYSWRVGEERAQLRATLAGTTFLPMGTPDYSRIGGTDPGDFVFADFVSGLYRHTETRVERLMPLELVGDLDHHAATTVAVGLLRRPGGDWGEYSAWLIEDGGQQSGLLPTRDGGLGISRCMQAELPTVRFISPNRILVVPGAEPGIFVYTREGVLKRSLEASLFSADDGCEIEPEQRHLLDDDGYRTAWLSRRRVIDEVVADDNGNVFLFVRHVPKPLAEPMVLDSRAGDSGLIVTGAAGEARVLEGETAEKLLQAAGINTLDDESATSVGRQSVVPGAAQIATLLGAAPGDLGDPTSAEPVEFDPEQAAALLAALSHVEPVNEAVQQPRKEPPRTRVCWDLIHARVDDLEQVSTQRCAIETDRSDMRLRADLDGERLVVLLRVDLMTALARSSVEPSQAFEARLRAPEAAP